MWYIYLYEKDFCKILKTELSKEPVREWLMKLKPSDKQVIGIDIKTVEFSWPLGMPLVRKLEANLWEVRSNISNRQIARILFTVKHSNMVLLKRLKQLQNLIWN